MSVFRPYCTFVGCFWANMGRFCDFFQKPYLCPNIIGHYVISVYSSCRTEHVMHQIA